MEANPGPSQKKIKLDKMTKVEELKAIVQNLQVMIDSGRAIFSGFQSALDAIKEKVDNLGEGDEREECGDDDSRQTTVVASKPRGVAARITDPVANVNLNPDIDNLRIAVITGDEALLAQLIDHRRVNLNRNLGNGMRALRLAASTRPHNLRILELLIGGGASVESVAPSTDWNFVHFIFDNMTGTHSLEEMTNFLVYRGVAHLLNQPDRRGITPFLLMIKSGLEVTDNLLTTLQQNNVDLHVRDNQRNSALRFAIHWQRENTMANLSLLARYGLEWQVVDTRGRNLLHVAANEGNAEQVNFLLQHGIEVNRRDADGNTPLHLVAKRFGLTSALSIVATRIAEALLGGGADKAITNNGRRTPHDLCAGNQCLLNKERMMNLLLL